MLLVGIGLQLILCPLASLGLNMCNFFGGGIFWLIFKYLQSSFTYEGTDTTTRVVVVVVWAHFQS